MLFNEDGSVFYMEVVDGNAELQIKGLARSRMWKGAGPNIETEKGSHG